MSGTSGACKTNQDCSYCCLKDQCRPKDDCDESFFGSFSFIIFLIMFLLSLLSCLIIIFRKKHLKKKKKALGVPDKVKRIFSSHKKNDSQADTTRSLQRNATLGAIDDVEDAMSSEKPRKEFGRNELEIENPKNNESIEVALDLNKHYEDIQHTNTNRKPLTEEKDEGQDLDHPLESEHQHIEENGDREEEDDDKVLSLRLDIGDE